MLQVEDTIASEPAEPLPTWPRRRWIGWVRVVFAAAAAGLLFLLLILPHLLWLGLSGGKPSPVARLYIRTIAAAAGLRIRFRGERLADHTLIVANHISWTDILVLASCTEAVFVARADVREWPGMGLLARLGGTIFVDRGSRRSVPGQVEAVAKALGRGRVVLFPEGTTGDGSILLPFRPPLFIGAREHAVQPIAIRYRPHGRAWQRGEREAFAWDGDKPFLPHLLAVLASGGAEAIVIVLPVMPKDSGDRKQRASEARALIQAALTEA